MRRSTCALRHRSFVTYTEAGVPRDGLFDSQIEPDAGSSNPFRAGARRDVQPRRYTITIVNGMPASPRAPNTIYTLAEPEVAIGMHMRNYVPDRSIDWTGGVGVPKVELHTADGKVLGEQEACAATGAPRRGKQVPVTVSKKLWLALNSLPWRPGDRTPADDFEVAPMVKFYNREHLILDTFFPTIPSDWLAVEKGGFWSNPVTRYGFTYLSQAYGKGQDAPHTQHLGRRRDTDGRRRRHALLVAVHLDRAAGRQHGGLRDRRKRDADRRQAGPLQRRRLACDRSPGQRQREVRRDLDGIRHR